ncbi:MAG: class I SAM-dependent methyltransferase [Verrucomicrobiota bacterium]
MSFDILAPFYRSMERFTAGRKLQRARTEFLDVIPVPTRILTVGEGHGPFLLECCRRYPEAWIVCVDASKAMMAQAKEALKQNGLNDARVQWVHADLLSWEPPVASFDLIVTHFFLDCFTHEQMSMLVPRLSKAADRGGSWLMADFQVPAHGWRRLRSKIILAMLYLFFRVATRLSAKSLITPDPLLQAAGWRLQSRAEYEWGLLKSDWWIADAGLKAPC